MLSNVQGNGFTMVRDSLEGPANATKDDSTLDTYDAAGNRLASLPAGSFTGDCTAADVQNPVGRLIITLLISTTPAQGITPASYALTMTAWNAKTGAKAWSAVLVKNQAQSISCPSSGERNGGDLWDFAATLDGKWGVFELPIDDAKGNIQYDAIDLTTGKTYPNENLVGVLGNYVVTGSGTDDVGDYPTKLTIAAPGGGPTFGTAAGRAGSDTASPQLSGGDGGLGLEELADTGYTGYTGSEEAALADTDASVTPNGSYLTAIVNDGNGNSWYRGFALPSIKQLWSVPVQDVNNPAIVGISDTALLVTQGDDGDARLAALDPKTGRQEWAANVGDGGVCDLTSRQVLVEDNNQLATLSASTGRQLSYKKDPYQDPDGSYLCPNVVENGLSGVGMSSGKVLQLLAP